MWHFQSIYNLIWQQQLGSHNDLDNKNLKQGQTVGR